jgi:hypothetical protein
MLFTAIFLAQGDHMQPNVLWSVQQIIGSVDLAFGVVFDALLAALATGGRWGFSRRGKVSLAAHGVSASVLAFVVSTSYFHEICAPNGGTLSDPYIFIETTLVRFCRGLLVLMQALTVPWSGGVDALANRESATICAILVVAMVSAAMVPGAQGINMRCDTSLSFGMFLIYEVAFLILFAALAGLELFRMHSANFGRRATGDGKQDELWHEVPPTGVVRPLVFFELVHVFVGMLNSAFQWAGMETMTGSYRSMLLLEGVTQQGLSTLVVVSLLFSPSFCKELKHWTATWGTFSDAPVIGHSMDSTESYLTWRR